MAIKYYLQPNPITPDPNDQSARVEKINVPTAAPALVAFTDVTSQTTNSILTPWGIGQIVGEELKFNPANATEGIFFIASDGTVTPATIIASRTEGKLDSALFSGLLPLGHSNP